MTSVSHFLVVAAVATCVIGRSPAALEADLVTTRGTVTVELEFAKAPRAVANFMTLATASRAWIEPATGAVGHGPYFNGLPFHAVVPAPGDLRAVTGSRDGSGGDRPGFTILDDLDPSLVHEPYVIAFESDGPNTGGSRFYLTGNASLSARDGRDVVFGKVPSAASRAVVDQILAAGAGATTLVSTSFRRTDPAAQAFDEAAVPLPLVVRPPSEALLASAGEGVRLDLARLPGTTLRASASPDLVDWMPVVSDFRGIDDGLPPGAVLIESQLQARRFYHFAVVEHPDAGGATGFAHRILVIDTPGTGEITYTFDATGLGGEYLNVPLPGTPLFFSGPFTVRPEIPAEYDAYRFSVLIHAEGLGGSPRNWIRGGFDEVEASVVTGRQVTAFFDAGMNPVFEDSGSLTLSRP